MFTDSGYDLSHVWVYCSETARDEKGVAQRNVEAVAKSTRGEDSYLNASFSLGKLRQMCKQQADPADTGVCVLMAVLSKERRAKD
jgi:hypothetical protein